MVTRWKVTGRKIPGVLLFLYDFVDLSIGVAGLILGPEVYFYDLVVFVADCDVLWLIRTILICGVGRIFFVTFGLTAPISDGIVLVLLLVSIVLAHEDFSFLQIIVTNGGCGGVLVLGPSTITVNSDAPRRLTL